MLNGYESKLANAYGMTHPSLSGAAGFSASGGGAQVERVLALDEITNRVRTNNDELAKLTMVLRERLDSLIGPLLRPGNTGDGPSSPPLPGRVQGLHAAAMTTTEFLSILATEVGRLDDL